jgi:ABC-type antimicrobial peptide transport system permease subunit
MEQRVNELGIRRALGGQTRDILGMVLRRALTLALAGAGLGLVGSVALTRLLRGMLVDIGPFDPLTFGALSALVIGVTVLAAFFPALRATRVDPMVALRTE